MYCMTRISQQECRGILELKRREKFAVTHHLKEVGVFSTEIKSKRKRRDKK